MGRRYSANGTVAVSTAYKTALSLIGGTTIRPRIFQIAFGATSTPADNAMTYLLQRLTADGTGTAISTISKYDPADPAAIATAKQTYSAEPTYTASETPFNLGAHQKGSLFWQAWDQLAQIVIPATANNGVGIQFKQAAGTPDMNAHFSWDE